MYCRSKKHANSLSQPLVFTVIVFFFCTFWAASSPDENAPADGEIRSADGKLLKDWKVRERRFVEEMTPDTLRQVLTAAVAIPDLQSASVYQPMRQAGLLGTWVQMPGGNHSHQNLETFVSSWLVFCNMQNKHFVDRISAMFLEHSGKSSLTTFILTHLIILSAIRPSGRSPSLQCCTDLCRCRVKRRSPGRTACAPTCLSPCGDSRATARTSRRPHRYVCGKTRVDQWPWF